MTDDSTTRRSDVSPVAPENPVSKPPDVLTELICERCGSVNLIRVKGCWYCEKCHYKFDCYGF
jgi:hypothetical protein